MAALDKVRRSTKSLGYIIWACLHKRSENYIKELLT